eukprot:353654-Chlamydomonas_euryale.AAC.4
MAMAGPERGGAPTWRPTCAPALRGENPRPPHRRHPPAIARHRRHGLAAPSRCQSPGGRGRRRHAGCAGGPDRACRDGRRGGQGGGQGRQGDVRPRRTGARRQGAAGDQQVAAREAGATVGEEEIVDYVRTGRRRGGGWSCPILVNPPLACASLKMWGAERSAGVRQVLYGRYSDSGTIEKP